MSEYSLVNKGKRYAERVVSGKVDACLYVRQACQRHLDDLGRQESDSFPYRFDRKKGNRVCHFAQQMPHVMGKWRGTKLILQPWQCFVLSVAFGWVLKDDPDTRRFREFYAEIPRKNGKSMLGAVIGNYLFADDGEPGAEVYAGATTEKQALKVFEPAWLMTRDSKEYREYYGLETSGTRKAPKGIYNLATNSKFFPVVGDPGDGDSPHCAIVDEYHEHKTSNLYDTFATGMGARQQPMMVVITTAGTSTAAPCYEKRQQCIKVLAGDIQNDTIFTIIYTLDDDDDWTDFKLWRKANPNYEVSLSEAYLKKQYSDAIQSAAKQNIIKCKHLNKWCNASVALFDMVAWAKCADPGLRIEDFEGEVCYPGIDLASKIDIAAMMPLFKRTIGGEDHYYLFSKFYIPEERTKGDDHTHYAGWVHDGYIKATPGNMLDIDAIEEDLRDLGRKYQIKEVPHDPWNAAQFVTHMANEGMEMVEIQQTVKQLSEPTKELQALILAGRIHHDGNPVLAWMMGNVVGRVDTNDNVKPNKERAEDKIDGAIGAVMALNRAIHYKPKAPLSMPSFI